MEHLKNPQANPGQGHGNKPNDKLHIFINGIKYTEEDGVKSTMTGRELAALVPVEPAENADVTYKNSNEKLALDQPISIQMADHFEVIRKTVVAG